MGILRGKIGKRILLPLLIIILLAGIYAAAAWFAGFFPFETQALNREKDQVQKAFQEPDACEEKNLSRAEELYGDNKLATEDKALLAEQIATCYSVKQNFEKAVEWFNKSQENYDAVHNIYKLNELKAAIENAKYFRDTPKSAEGSVQFEDKGEL